MAEDDPAKKATTQAHMLASDSFDSVYRNVYAFLTHQDPETQPKALMDKETAKHYAAEVAGLYAGGSLQAQKDGKIVFAPYMEDQYGIFGMVYEQSVNQGETELKLLLPQKISLAEAPVVVAEASNEEALSKENAALKGRIEKLEKTILGDLPSPNTPNSSSSTKGQQTQPRK